ncbi:hypothetical protein LTR53_002461 [Teratosphaeriaceae sp. CCFEE 6253]|nr:hypothetical protein LTR53_002461 [Teratosphaeriaceae sp. CCFEE 6253]
MTRMRSFSFPRIPSAKGDDMAPLESPSRLFDAPAHSRSSSGASNTSSPIASTFSSRSHNRYSSSTSSLASAPDSPVNVTKSPLHDLAEEPAEREDVFSDQTTPSSVDEPMCICDTPFCGHRQTPRVSESTTPVSSSAEWAAGDDFLDSGELPGSRNSKRRRSVEQSSESLSSRLSRRWPSISARWRDRRPTTSVSDTTIQSAPHSRSSSIRLPAIRHSLAAHFDLGQMMTPPITPVDSQPETSDFRRPRGMSRPQKPIDIVLPEQTSEQSDLQELISTPLLPPRMAEHFGQSQEILQSPLQSPSIALPGSAISLNGTPSMTPTHAAMPTPPLSSRPSVASFGLARSLHALYSTPDIPQLRLSQESDPWSLKLGHANFHITPEPYLPDKCDMYSCKRLLNDWEVARAKYMRQALRISEHYGPTSQTFKFTEQKWAEIDAQWRAYHELANAEAGVRDDTTLYQPLAETQPLAAMPSLIDPHQPSKFPMVAEADIVGPMVKYAKIQRQPSRKPAFLKLFTDPASLLGGRSPFGLKR